MSGENEPLTIEHLAQRLEFLEARMGRLEMTQRNQYSTANNSVYTAHQRIDKLMRDLAELGQTVHMAFERVGK